KEPRHAINHGRHQVSVSTDDMPAPIPSVTPTHLLPLRPARVHGVGEADVAPPVAAGLLNEIEHPALPVLVALWLITVGSFDRPLDAGDFNATGFVDADRNSFPF